jgi:hypothetical protein
MAIFSLSIAVIKSYSTGRKLLKKHFIFLLAFFITHTPPYYLCLFVNSEENKERIYMVFDIQTDMIITSSAGTILTLSRLANKKLIYEIYYSIFKRKDSPGYIEYRFRYSNPKSIRTPLTISREDNLDFMNASLYYDDLYTNTTFIVIYIQSVLEILATLSIRFDEDIVKPSQFLEIKYLLYSENSIYDTRKFKCPIWRYRKDDRFTDDIIDTCNRYLVGNKTMRVTEYAPNLFQNIRSKLGYSSRILSEYFINRAFSPSYNYSRIYTKDTNQGGRSDAFFFTNFSERFIIKSISKGEMKYFINKMLFGYYKRVFNHEDSILSRILGVFGFDHIHTNIIILENITPYRENALLFDMKGSTYQRSTISNPEQATKGKTMKDMDFKLLDFKLYLDPAISIELYDIIAKDVEYLKSVGVMDYSILVGVYENYNEASSRYTIFSKVNQVCNIGIIDFMQDYDIKKRAEGEIKRMVSGMEISSIEPDEYAKRFLVFIKRSLLSIE